MTLRLRIRPLRLATKLAILALPMLFASNASAGLVIAIQPTNLSATLGSTGNTFEVDLVNTDATTYQLSGFSVNISVSPSSGITLDSASDSTAQTYVFTGNSVGFLFNNPSGPNTGNISDNANDLMQNIAGNTTYGLGVISFSVDAMATPGLYGVTIDPVNSSLSGPPPDFLLLPFTTSDGQISVTGSGSVPEPSSILLLASSIPLGLVYLLCRKRAVL